MTKRRKDKPRQMPQDAPAAPARIRHSHVKDRTLSAVAGAQEGYRNRDWPIEIAYDSGRLKNPGGDHSDIYHAESRWQAIREYDATIEASQIRSGRDSTQLDIVSGGGGYPITEARSAAIKKLVSIDSALSYRDRLICRKLCEGHSLPGAVRAACGEEYVFAVAARVRDALDGLTDAILKARKSGYSFDLRRL